MQIHESRFSSLVGRSLLLRFVTVDVLKQIKIRNYNLRSDNNQFEQIIYGHQCSFRLTPDLASHCYHAGSHVRYVIVFRYIIICRSLEVEASDKVNFRRRKIMHKQVFETYFRYLVRHSSPGGLTGMPYMCIL